MTLAYYDTDEDLPENQATPDPDMATSLRRASYVEEFALISNERTRQDFAETVLKSGSNLVRGAFGSTPPGALAATGRSDEHTSELQSLMRISYAVFCLNKKNKTTPTPLATQ